MTLAAPSAQAADVLSTSLTGAVTGTGGLAYAKQGMALTLNISTDNNTKCVALSGAVVDQQTSTGGRTAWSFALTVPPGNGLQSITIKAGNGNNAQGCNGNVGTDSASYTVDNTGPVVTGAIVPTPNLAGWNKANVTVTWTATDTGGSGIQSILPASELVTVEGTATKTAIATDNVGNTGSGSLLVKLDKTAPTISGSRTPAANANGWNNTNVTASFTSSDATSGIKTSSGPTIKSTDGANQSVTGTATDNADNSASATVSGINIDKVDPTISGAPATTGRNAAGWYQGDVSVTWTAGDALSGLDGPSPANSTITGEGTALTATQTVADKAGNINSATSSPAVKIDRTVPLTTVTAPPAWNKTSVALTLVPTDALSGVATTSYSLDGGAQQSGTAISVSSEGSHTLTFWSTDVAGNVEPPHTVSFGIDKTSPSIGHTQSPAVNADGWNNTSVTITFNCSDALASIASCTGPQTVSTNGLSQTVTGTATDNAGNTATDPATVSIDKVDPTIGVSLDRVPDLGVWYSAPVTATYTCDDGLSGIRVCGPVKTFGEGADQGDTGTAIDAAGNAASRSVSGVNVDLTPPTITGTVVTSPNANGWFHGDVTVHWTCGDNLSGVVACPANSTVTGEGGNLSAGATVFDRAGHSATATVTNIQIDRSAPSTLAVGVPSGWQNGPVTMTLQGSDNLSGVDSPYFTVDGAVSATQGASVTIGTQGTHTVSYYSVDNAGNVEDARSFTVQIDLSSPTISAAQTIDTAPDGVQPAHAWNNTDVTVTFTCDDQATLSGLASCSGPRVVTTEGTDQAVTGTATDNAGNSADATSLVNVDKTPPVITGAPDRDPNTALWYRALVTVTFQGTDDRSGVSTLSSPSTLSGDGADQSVTGQVTDAAGNLASRTVGGINIDSTPPTLSAAPTTNPNVNGWYRSPVTLDWSCDDNLSGVVPDGCPASSLLNNEGDNEVANASVEDVAGNHTDATSAPVKIDKTAPGTTASAPSAWVNGNVTVTFSAYDALSAVAATHYSVNGGAEATGTSFELTTEGTHNITYYSVDNAGNVEAAHHLQVLIDKQAPTITHTLSPEANNHGWNNSNVTVTFTCLDQPGLSGVNTCTDPQSVTLEGQDQLVTGATSDNAGNHATDPVRVSLDKTPPTISGFRSPAFNGFGWNNTDVTVHFDAGDTLSGLDSKTPDTTLGEGKDQSLTGTATDLAGNSSQATVSGISVDKTSPTISGEPTTPAVNGWYRGDVTIAWTCLDQALLSGIAGCPENSVIGGEGQALSVTGTATDKADNSTTVSSPTVRIDRTAPVTGANAPAGWNNVSVTVTLTGVDNLSGVADTLYSLDGAAAESATSLTIDTQGIHTVRYWSVDRAGNVEVKRTTTVSIDLTNPTLTHTVSPVPNAAGWNNTSPVTVSFTCDDEPSGVASCPAEKTVSTDTDGQPVTGRATDNAGNVGTDTATVKLDTVKPTIDGESDRGPNGNGWYAGDVTVGFTCDDSLSGIIAGGCTAPVTIGEGAAQTVPGSARDAAGNSSHTAVGPISIDKTDPTLSGAPTTANLGANGWYTDDVTISWSASDALSGLDGGIPPNSTITSEGNSENATTSVQDLAGNQTTATSPAVKIDRHAPGTTVNGPADWVNGNVDLTLTPTDSLSGVASTWYELDGGAAKAGLTISIAAEGVHSLEYWSVDKAGNLEPHNSLTVKIDKTNPVITNAQSPSANAQGWNNGNVTVTFSCTDTGSDAANSGIASCTAPQVISVEGGNQPVQGTAVDNADNSANDTAHVSIDRTRPTVSGDLSSSANANGWFKDPVTATFTCVDQAGLSGVLRCPGTRTFAQGANQRVTVTATDAADNESNPFSINGVNVDTTPPTLFGAATTAPNAGGWYNGDVTVHWTAADGLSGVDTTTDPGNSTVSGEGNALSANASVSDLAGNTTTGAVTGIHIDRTAPQTNPVFASGWQNSNITVALPATDNLSGVEATYYTIDGGAEQSGSSVIVSTNGTHTVSYWSEDSAGNLETPHTVTVLVDKAAPAISGAPTTAANTNGWYNGPVAVHFTCADQAGLSGVASCGPDATVSAQGANSLNGTAVDRAGNSATTTVAGINIDTVEPAVTIGGVVNGGVYKLGAAPVPTCGATDATSGVVGTCVGSKSGGTANGVSTFTYSATATDRAGNVGTTIATYRVIYGYGDTLFLQPVNDTAHQTGVSTSVFNAGQTIPMKFQLRNAAGQLVQAGSAPKWLTPVKGGPMGAAINEAAYAESPTSGTTYGWSGTQYQYNWKTEKSQAGYYWRVGVTLDDGQTYYVNIGLR